MVICCVPQCKTDSLICDPSVTFHEFPSSPDIAAKWIKQINIAIKSVPMWVPRGKVFICSKHFLQTDFKDNSDALKPRSIPAVFGHRYIGVNAEITQPNNKTIVNQPLIVKVIKPIDGVIENKNNIEITGVYSTESPGWNHSSKVQNTVNYSKNSKKFAQPSPQNEQVDVTAPPHTLDTASTATSVQNKFNPNETTSVINGKKATTAKRKKETTPRVYSRKKQNANNDLIEISPNTFLKINPEVIKVNRKLTPSGNTVLQFLMNQKYANSQDSILPKVIQGPFTLPEADSAGNTKEDLHVNNKTGSSLQKTTKSMNNSNSAKKNQSSNKVQHVLGHLIDTHACEELCNNPELTEDHPNLNENVTAENTKEDVPVSKTVKEKSILHPIKPKKMQSNLSKTQNTEPSSLPSDQPNPPECILYDTSSELSDTNVVTDAPILLTTKNPISHCFSDKPKFVLQLKKKNRQIATLKYKISSLTKKIEELEDKCIVQDRQLSYTFMKRIKAIRKNATKGDPTATYILDLIRCYTNNSGSMRWSESTLAQSAVWVKKAPYAYEYFKKADLFKLPCIKTVKRFMKQKPELVEMQRKLNKKGNIDNSSSSSDFDFDESDNEIQEPPALDESSVTCETILTEIAEATEHIKDESTTNTEEIPQESENEDVNTSSNVVENKDESPDKNSETGTPITLDSSNLELQEIFLPSGEILQCYSSTISSGKDAGQYFIIPNTTTPNASGENEYSVVQAESLPAFLQNYVHSELDANDQELVHVESMDDKGKV